MKRLIALTFFLLTVSVFAQDEVVPEWRRLARLAIAHEGQNQYDSALIYSKMALEVAQAEFGDNDTTVAKLWYYVGYYQQTMGDYENAEKALNECLDLLFELVTPDHPLIGTGMNALGHVYETQGKYADAEAMYKRALEIAREKLPENDPEIANAMANMAGLYLQTDRLEEAKSLTIEALEIRRDSLGENSAEVARSYVDLAGIEWTLGNATEALRLYNLSLSIYESQEEPDDHLIANLLTNLGNLYLEFGDYDKADSIHRVSLQKLETIFEPNHNEIAELKYNIGLGLFERGRYFDAAPFLEEAMVSFEITLGIGNSKVADVKSVLGLLYDKIGNGSRCYQVFKEALAIQEKAFGPEHFETTIGLNNLGHYHLQYGNLDSARFYFERALKIRRASRGAEDRTSIVPLYNLALVGLRQTDYALAQRSLLESIKIIRNTYGAAHPDLARNYMTLAECQHALGDLDSADVLFAAASDIFKDVFGEDHFDYAECLEKMAAVAVDRNEPEQSANLMLQAMAARYNNYSENVGFLTEEDALMFTNAVKKAGANLLSLYFANHKMLSTKKEDIATAVLNTKGLVADESANRRERQRQSDDTTLAALNNEWQSVRARLCQAFYHPGKDSAGIENLRIEIDSLKEIADELESKIGRSARGKQQVQAINTSLEKIAGKLPKGWNIIEYFQYRSDSSTWGHGEQRYAAIIIDGEGLTAIKDMGPAAVIDKTVQEFRGHCNAIAETKRYPTKLDSEKFAEIAGNLYHLILEPIIEHLVNAEVLVFAPDGSLNLIPFAALVEKNGQYLIENYAVHYLSTSRDVLRFLVTTESGSGLLALGNPDFDCKTSSASAENGQRHSGDMVKTRDFLSDCAFQTHWTISSLPGTKNEVELVAASWKSNTNEITEVLLGPEASKENFKKHAGGKRIIHIATHGFFFDTECDNQAEAKDNRNHFAHTLISPMFLSGILLACANNSVSNGESQLSADGILSAYEIAAMDLTGTELVALSACESGLGQVYQGEGVFGLRRAFQVAGARTVLSSLWSVDDKATSEFMSQIYRNPDVSIPVKLRQSQLAQISKLRETGFSVHPFLWGAFVATGNWR